MKKILLFLLISIFSIFLISLVNAGSSCTPIYDYDVCWSSNLHQYGCAWAKAQIHTFKDLQGTYKGGYYVGEVWTKALCSGTGHKLTYQRGLTSWGSCTKSGCPGTSVGDNQKIVIARPGEENPQYIAFYCHNYDSCGSSWAWAWAGWGWTGEDGHYNFKVVECYDNSDCSSGQICDKSGDWTTWSCKTPECITGEEKCIGISSYKCENNKWVNKGEIIGACGVECLANPDCPSTTEGDRFCDGNDVIQPSSFYTCVSKKCIENTQNIFVKTCDYKCENGECTIEIIEPEEPMPGGFMKFINSIINWLKNLFTIIFTQQAVIGPQIVEPNTVHTYQIDLSASIPDSDWSDGTYQIQYANWALVDSSGNIIQEGTWEKINGVYQKSVTITTPSNIGDFVLLGMITQFDMTFNNVIGQWETGEEYIVNKEAIDLKTEYSIIEPEEPVPGGFIRFITSIINWLKDLWVSIFG